MYSILTWFTHGFTTYFWFPYWFWWLKCISFPNNSMQTWSNTLQYRGILNLLVPSAPFLYPLKTSGNRKVFWCFQGVEKGCIENIWAKILSNIYDRVFLVKILNPFVPNASFPYPLKIPEKCKVFWCFQGVEKECIGNKWVISAIYNSLELVLMILSYIGIFSFWKCYSDLEVSSAKYTHKQCKIYKRHVFIWSLLYFGLQTEYGNIQPFPYIGPYSHSTQTKFSIWDFLSKSEHIHIFLSICLHLMKEFLTQNYILYAVSVCHILARESLVFWFDFTECPILLIWFSILLIRSWKSWYLELLHNMQLLIVSLSVFIAF